LEKTQHQTIDCGQLSKRYLQKLLREIPGRLLIQAVYYSRSRKKLWFKGEESGHTQFIKAIYMDCDDDVQI
jgi:hypothetical protein